MADTQVAATSPDCRPKYLHVEMTIQTLQPITFTHHGQKGLPLMVRGVDEQGQPLKTVYLPAGQIRGRIRHEAAYTQLDEERRPKTAGGEPKKLGMARAYMVALGQSVNKTKDAKDSKEEVVRISELQKAREADPFLGLFGTWKLPSRLFVSHFMPEVNVAAQQLSGIRRDLDTNEAIMGLLDADEQNELYERQARQRDVSLAKAQIEQLEKLLKDKKRKKAADAAEIARLEAALVPLQSLVEEFSEDDDSSNTKHLVDMTVIPPGIELRGTLRVQSPVATDLQHLLNALDGVSRMPMMGAQRARGCGEVKGEATFKDADGFPLAVVSFGGFKPATIAMTVKGQAFLGRPQSQPSAELAAST